MKELAELNYFFEEARRGNLAALHKNTIKTSKAIRLYEVLVREHNKQRRELYIPYEEMAKIIYEPNKKFRINESLKRLIPQLEHLVEISQDKTDRFYVYLKFKFKDQKALEGSINI